MYAIGLLFYWSALSYFALSWMSVAVKLSHLRGKSKHDAKVRLRRLHLFLLTTHCGTSTSVLILWLMPFFDDPKTKNLLTVLHALTSAVFGITQTIAVVTSGSGIRKILLQGTDSIPSASREVRVRVIGNITKRMRSSIFTSSFAALLWILVAFIPYVRTQLCYVLGPLWFIAISVIAVSLHILNPPPAKRPSELPNNVELGAQPLPSPHSPGPTTPFQLGRKEKSREVDIVEEADPDVDEERDGSIFEGGETPATNQTTLCSRGEETALLDDSRHTSISNPLTPSIHPTTIQYTFPSSRDTITTDISTPEKPIQEIGRAVQQECRDRSRMPSSA
eukprot:TRINITY_DN7591_c0_g1_i9.p1 TRINITY_DN7591_c0_g1~~TRINITY_DN7591_c0_g1_i9.p1  ORF type:complete len:335 (-),score=30.62 TRINITY_DN7591_c0_g1_i9:10-1014(-)